jgi:hypothetical protein
VPEEFRGLLESLPADRFPHIAAHAEAMTTGSGEERFEFGLNVLVAGLEAVSATCPPVDGPAEQAQ